MCYDVRHMSDAPAASTRVGVRELRQNLSVYLRRIDEGERFEVTDRGTPVALLIPLPASRSPLERLVAEGRARIAAGVLSPRAPGGAPQEHGLGRQPRRLRGMRHGTR